MADAGFAHSEKFLQWVWENVLFDFTELRTTSGEEIMVFNTGELNTSDGPDFKHAHLEIGGIRWFGDVEIHTRSSHWNAHRHHTDINFNTVVLHVVVEDQPNTVRTQNGSTPFTLNLKPYLSENLYRFLKSFEEDLSLPCSNSLHFISEAAFKQQIEKAHAEYFEKKADDFLQFFDPNLLPSKSWRNALILSVWDGLGISHNRKAMQQIAKQLLLHKLTGSNEDIIQQAFNIAGLSGQSTNISWNFKSIRPASHPKNRIREAVLMTQQIRKEPFKNFLHPEADQLWVQWVDTAALNQTNRFKILYGTVFLPALYVLGNLFASANLSRHTFQAWKQLKTPIPNSLLKKFRSLDLHDNTYKHKLGAIHQLNAYCKPAKCSECFVLKKAIES